MKEVIRWIGFLPAAIVAYFISFALLKTGFGFFGHNSLFYNGEASWTISGILSFVLSNIGAGYMSVLVGGTVAPSKKRIVAISLTALIAVMCGFSIFAGFVIAGDYSILEVVSSAVFSIGGAIAACVKIKEDDNNENIE